MDTKLNKTDIASLFQVTTNTIDNWRDNGFPREGKGRYTKYPVKQCIEWYADRKIHEKMSRTEVGQQALTVKEAQAKKTTYEAMLKELELYEAQGQLVRVDRVSAYVDRLVTQLKSAVLSIPGSWSEHLIGLKDRTEALERLDELSRKFLNHLANEEMDFTEEEEDLDDVE